MTSWEKPLPINRPSCESPEGWGDSESSLLTLQLRRKVLPWDNSPFLAFFSPTAPKAGTEPYGKVGQPPWGCPGRRNLGSAVQRPFKAQWARARSKTKDSTFKFRLKREHRRTHLKNATCLQHIFLNTSLERFESSLNGTPFPMWICGSVRGKTPQSSEH